MKFLFSAGIILFRRQQKKHDYLLLHYPHGHWDLPKGKIEKGESKTTAALRELKEETGLATEIIDGFSEQYHYFFKQDGNLIKKTVYFFIGEALSDGVTLSDEHIGYEWLPFDQAMERLTFDNTKMVLEKAEKFLINTK